MANPLVDFLNDKEYEKIKPFLNLVAVRDYHIQKAYRNLRFGGMKSGDAIDILRKSYPTLQWETLRKIAVSVPRKFN